jgi:hypothetical protein
MFLATSYCDEPTVISLLVRGYMIPDKIHHGFHEKKIIRFSYNSDGDKL